MDWRDIPSLSALRAFEAAARLGSYTAAAQELNVTHAAIAQHVRTLEAFFDQPLMTREGRGVSATMAGRRLATDLGSGFAEIAAGVRGLIRARGDGPISLTTTRSFAENWLMPRLAGFWQARPDIPLTITADDSVNDLRRDGLDMAIRYGRGTWPGLESELLTSGNTVVVAHPSLAAQLPDTYSPAAPDAPELLRGLPWIVDVRLPEFETWLRAKGLDPETLRRTVLDSNTLVLAACRAGGGVSLQPRAVVARDIAERRLVVLLEDEDDEIGYYIARQPGRPSERLQVFLDWLKDA